MIMKIVLLSLFISACSSPQKHQVFAQHLAQLQCAEALANLPETQWKKIENTSKTLVKGATSVLISGPGYAVDGLVFLAGGIGILALCSPVFLASALTTTGSGNLSCLPAPNGVVDQYKNYKSVGHKTMKELKNWRCPDVDHISQGLRKVAKCYRQKGDEKKAQRQLSVILADTNFSNCLSARERAHVLRDIQQATLP